MASIIRSRIKIVKSVDATIRDLGTRIPKGSSYEEYEVDAPQFYNFIRDRLIPFDHVRLAKDEIAIWTDFEDAEGSYAADFLSTSREEALEWSIMRGFRSADKPESFIGLKRNGNAFSLCIEDSDGSLVLASEKRQVHAASLQVAGIPGLDVHFVEAGNGSFRITSASRKIRIWRGGPNGENPTSWEIELLPGEYGSLLSRFPEWDYPGRLRGEVSAAMTASKARYDQLVAGSWFQQTPHLSKNLVFQGSITASQGSVLPTGEWTWKNGNYLQCEVVDSEASLDLYSNFFQPAGW